MLLTHPEGRAIGVKARERRTPDVGQPFSATNPMAFRLMQSRTTSGVNVNADAVFGLSTILECVRQPAQLIATLDWGTWDWGEPAVPKLVTSEQDQLAELIDFPGYGSKFDLFQDISTSIDGWGGALVQKIKGVTRKDKGKVIALRMVDPDMFQVKWEDGKRVFKVKITERGEKGRWRTREETWTEADALYIRGFSTHGFLSGVVPWQTFRQTMGNALAIEEFAANWWRNQGMVSMYLAHPEMLSPTQAEEILDIFEETHGGLDNAGRPALLSGGAKLEQVKVTVADMQLRESRDWMVDDICRMMNWPAELVTQATGSGLRYVAEEIVLKTQKVYLQPRTRRIRDAFNADPDLFKGNPLWLDVRFDPIEAISAQTRAESNLSNRQAGIVTANELRVPMGLPPHPDGDELLITPVGGAPNEDGGAKGKKGQKSPSEGYDPAGSPGGADETN